MSEAPKQSEQAAGKSSPTKGPWHRDTSTGSLGHDIYNSGENEELLATVYPMERDGLHNSWVANATLIASAPALLEALEAAFDYLPDEYYGPEDDGDDKLRALNRKISEAIRAAKGGQ